MTSTARGPDDSGARPRRSLRGRLWLGACGLLVGAAGALVAMAPTFANDHGSERVEAWFAERYRGRIVLGEIALAWSRPGTIAGELSDPQGAGVVSGSLSVPPLWELLPALFGRVGALRAQADVAIVRDVEGRTNLERALARRDGQPHDPFVRGALELELVVEGERWSWRDDGLGHTLELEGVEASLTVHPDEPIVVRGSGHTRSGAPVRFGADVFAAPDEPLDPQRVELALDGEDVRPADWIDRPVVPATVTCALRGLLTSTERTLDLTVRGDGLDLDVATEIAAAPIELPGLQASDDGAWDVALDATGTLPSALLDSWFDLDGFFAGVLGSSIAIELGAHGRGSGVADAHVPLTLAARAGAARVDWQGTVEQLRLRAGADEGLTATLAWSSTVRDALVGPLMPLARGLERDADGGPLIVAVRDVDCGLPLALDDVSAKLELKLGTLTFGLPPKLAGELGLDRALTLPGSDLVELRLERGVAHYPGLHLELDGQRLPLVGRYDLRSDAIELDGSLPAALVTTQLLERLGPLAGVLGSAIRLDFTIGGTEGRPELRVHPPDLDGIGDGLFGGGLRDLFETSLPPK